MVEVKKVQNLYFSPTGNTKKILEAISRGMGFPSAEGIDLTLPKHRDAWSGEFDADLLLIGVPVYGNTYPSIMLPSLKKLNGEGRLAVPIAVCDNCKIGTALAELSGILKKQGFTIPAAGNFVGEHTCATDEYRLGTGRPDETDLKKAFEFGEKIADKVSTNPADITSVYSGQLYLQCYANGSLEAQGYVNGGLWLRTILVKSSRKETDRCRDCMSCVESCPTGAINADNIEINDQACVRCFVYTSVCPSGLLRKEVAPPPELATWWKIQEKRRGEPLLFL